MLFSEAVYELVLFGFAPLFLTVATIWILWHVLEKIDEVIDIRFFLTFILVAVPFVMLIYFGGTIILYSKMMAVSGGSRQVFLPLTPLSRVKLIGTEAVIYIGLMVWLWSHWRKHAKVRR